MLWPLKEVDLAGIHEDRNCCEKAFLVSLISFSLKLLYINTFNFQFTAENHCLKNVCSTHRPEKPGKQLL